MKKEKSMSNKLSEILIASFFTALICVGTYIKIPFVFVPMTLQFFFVNLAIIFQNKRYGVLSVFTYIALGLMGFPVFSGGGGIGYILKPTFGYIIGFLLCAIVTGFIKEKSSASFKANLIFSIINIVIIYACGVTYFYLLSNFYLENPIGLKKLLVVGCFIFIPSDMLSGYVSSYLSVKLKRVLKSERLTKNYIGSSCTK